MKVVVPEIATLVAELEGHNSRYVIYVNSSFCILSLRVRDISIITVNEDNKKSDIKFSDKKRKEIDSVLPESFSIKIPAK